ncbi:thioredoxin family protein [Marinobacter zhejiangensis]|uniref:Thioredoxin n=1 Tax=Marinobacter zhejiangensis TaxID=488535 RepID=A0A1I4Q0N0_9GAMM|nr:thioredoxin family protein [Marinobacter zhejiangensis]SFM33426.1 Thioredoxin [Marinobacter zhejiangensis]
MKTVSTELELTGLLEDSPAVLLLFGGHQCGVCQAIKPQLERLVREHFPGVVTGYIDCQDSAASLCATRGIFSLPVVQLWFEGQRFAEFARVFSIGEVRASMERPYQALMAGG